MGEEDAIKRVLDGALDAVVATDRAGRIVGWNRAAEALFGWRRDEALDRNVCDLIVPARDRDEFLARHRGIAAGEIRARNERVLRDRTGGEFPVETSASATEVCGETI